MQFFPRSKKGVKTQNQTRVLHFTIPEKQKRSPLFGILLHWTDLEVDIICMKVLGTENTSAANPPFSIDLIATDYPIHSRKKKKRGMWGEPVKKAVFTQTFKMMYN